MLMPPDEPLPSIPTTLPVPFGRRLMSLFEDEMMSLVPTSRSPDRVAVAVAGQVGLNGDEAVVAGAIGPQKLGCGSISGNGDDRAGLVRQRDRSVGGRVSKASSAMSRSRLPSTLRRSGWRCSGSGCL